MNNHFKTIGEQVTNECSSCRAFNKRHLTTLTVEQRDQCLIWLSQKYHRMAPPTCFGCRTWRAPPSFRPWTSTSWWLERTCTPPSYRKFSPGIWRHPCRGFPAFLPFLFYQRNFCNRHNFATEHFLWTALRSECPWNCTFYRIQFLHYHS